MDPFRHINVNVEGSITRVFETEKRIDNAYK